MMYACILFSVYHVRCCFVFFSWIDSRNPQHLVPCVIYYGQIPWKTSAMRKPQNILLTIALGVAHISIGVYDLSLVLFQHAYGILSRPAHWI